MIVDLRSFIRKYLKKRKTFSGNNYPIYLTRMIRYTVGGFIVIIIDYSLLSIFVEIFKIYYLIAVALAYAIAHSIYYVINRVWIFKETKSNVAKAYVYFISFGLMSMLLTTSLVGLFTEYFGWYYFFSRIITSIIVGITNFIFNYLITFKMGSEFIYLNYNINN